MRATGQFVGSRVVSHIQVTKLHSSRIFTSRIKVKITPQHATDGTEWDNKYSCTYYIYIVRFYNVCRRLPPSTLHSLRLFHSPILRSLPLIAVYIPSLQVLRGRPRSFRPSGFQLIIIFVNRVGFILSTCPYQMSCFQVTLYSTVS